MNLIECPGCSGTTPVFRTCVHCDEQIGEDQIPAESEIMQDMTQRISEQAATANHDSVSFDVLRSDHGKYDRPLGAYLFKDEQPIAVYETHTAEIHAPNDERWYLNSSITSTGLTVDSHLLITDQRLVYVVPHEQCDQVASIHYRDVTNIDSKTPLVFVNQISIDLANGFRYVQHVNSYSEGEIDQAVDLIHGQSEEFNSAEATAVQLVDEMDGVLSDSDGAAEGFSRLSELFQSRENISQVDRAFEESESFDDLLKSLAEFRQSTKYSEDSLSTKESSESTVRSVSDGDTIGQKVKYIAQEAEPKTVGGYAIGAAILGASYAVTAPISTTVGMAAILTGGASAGAYASANPDSQLAEIDPISTAVQMRMMGLTRKSSSAPGGYGTGALLSAVDQVDTEELPPEYAKWAAQADINTIMKDAELAAQAADRSPKSHDERAARALGGVVGIAHSYVNAGDGPDLEQLVDQDLYQDAIDELDE